MEHENIGKWFLRERAGKHFVILTYRARFPESSSAEGVFCFSSCFVVEVERRWFLVTAGHVINNIKTALDRGVELSGWELQDHAAGHSFVPGVPFPFDVKDWIVIEDEYRGIDYAATLLSDLLVRNLVAGRIQPITEIAWGPVASEDCENWLLVGIPRETISAQGAKHVARLTLIPLDPVGPPEEARKTAENKLFGAIRTNPVLDGGAVRDIDGMSGGPVFGTKSVDGVLRYWAIGIQSSWYELRRIACFCPLPGFLLAVKQAIRKSQAG